MTTSKVAQSGNVLFLILIAVALFAALSYAVTQSSRSGSGDASSEKNLVSSSEITQYPAGVRTSIVRMVIGGVGADEIIFDGPTNFPTIVSASKTAQAVFYPSGGGASYQNAPADLLINPLPTSSDGYVAGEWIFSSKFQVKNIGTTAANETGNDVIAFLPYVTKNLCLKLDTQLGIAAAGTTDAPVGDLATVPTVADMMDLAHPGIPSGLPVATIGTAATAAPFAGQPFGCFKTGDGFYVYYHVLVER